MWKHKNRVRSVVVLQSSFVSRPDMLCRPVMFLRVSVFLLFYAVCVV
jgi:hypothetical protein